MQPRELGDSTWTNLTSFAGHGGKLLFYHGLSDPWFSPLDTLGYYEKMAKDTGNGSVVPGAASTWCLAWDIAKAEARRWTVSTC